MSFFNNFENAQRKKRAEQLMRERNELFINEVLDFTYSNIENNKKMVR